GGGGGGEGWGRGGGAGEVGVHAIGAGPALGDRPDDQGLTTAGVTAGEDTVDRGLVVLVPLHVATLVQLDAELLEEALALRAEEAHREQHQLGPAGPLGAPDRDQTAVLELPLDQVQPGDVALGIGLEVDGGDRVDPLATLLV